MTCPKLLLLLIILIVSSPESFAKKRCKALLDKLHNVQALQRSSYSAKRGVSLRNKEDKAREKWWQCETGKVKKTKKKKKKKPSNSSSNNQKLTELKTVEIKAGIPFQTTQSIAIKEKYLGKKRQAWLKFYQQPKQCQRPKTLSGFAFCSENKQTQRSNFEKQYEKKSF